MYEGLHFGNQETRVILKVKTIVQNILSVLSNLTGVVVNENTTMEAEELVACGAPHTTMAREEEEGGEETDEVSTGREGRYRTDGYTGERSGTRTEYEESTGNQPPSAVSVCSIIVTGGLVLPRPTVIAKSSYPSLWVKECMFL